MAIADELLENQRRQNELKLTKEQMEAMGAPPTPPEMTLKQVVAALDEELGSMRRRLYETEERIARYDRIFETAFREEAERRLHISPAPTLGGMGCCEAPLSRLKRTAGW